MPQAERPACAKALRQKGAQACEVLVYNLQKPPWKVLWLWGRALLSWSRGMYLMSSSKSKEPQRINPGWKTMSKRLKTFKSNIKNSAGQIIPFHWSKINDKLETLIKQEIELQRTQWEKSIKKWESAEEWEGSLHSEFWRNSQSQEVAKWIMSMAAKKTNLGASFLDTTSAYAGHTQKI